VQATFFVIGRLAAAHPGLVRAELAAGDEVENHTYRHPRLAAYRSEALLLAPSQISRELARTTAAIERDGAPRPWLFRPPYGLGVFNPVLVGIASRQRMLTVGWNVALEHYILNPAPLATQVRRMVRAIGPGSIILAHDGQRRRERTLAALPLLLRALQQRCYAVVPVEQLLRRAGVRAA